VSPQRNPRPSARDFTGRTRESNAAANAQEIQERSAQLSMATAAAAEADEKGLFDPKTNERLDLDEVQVAAPTPPPQPFGGPRLSEEPVFTGKEDVTEMEAVPPPAPRPNHGVLESPFVTVRLNQDVEDMTFGMVGGRPNNFSFLEGRAYRIERPLYEHLNALGLIHQVVAMR